MTTETGSAEALLLALDAGIDPIVTAGDVAALDPILADDFVYTHSTGQSQSKAEWLESLKPLAASGRRRRVPSNIQVEVHGDVAVSRADLDIEWNDGTTRYLRYVRVYRLQGGRWRALSQRTVPAPDRAPS